MRNVPLFIGLFTWSAWNVWSRQNRYIYLSAILNLSILSYITYQQTKSGEDGSIRTKITPMDRKATSVGRRTNSSFFQSLSIHLYAIIFFLFANRFIFLPHLLIACVCACVRVLTLFICPSILNAHQSYENSWRFFSWFILPLLLIYNAHTFVFLYFVHDVSV